ncbi:MAG: hypothetical protein JWO67_7189 [Streptosporangiaceae bacterium]|nr:hypothetical protein [Streptosporangiaceae bacterium]
MADRIKYEADYHGTRELMTSPEMLACMGAAAEQGKQFAVSISPRRTGEYSESFHVEGSTAGGPNRDRAEARLTNTSSHAADVEWRNHGGMRILGKTVDHIEAHGAD